MPIFTTAPLVRMLWRKPEGSRKPEEAVGQQCNRMIKCPLGLWLGSKRYRKRDYMCEGGEIIQHCLSSLPPSPSSHHLEKNTVDSPSPRWSLELLSPDWKLISRLPDFSGGKKSLGNGSVSGRTLSLYHKYSVWGKKAKKMVLKSLTYLCRQIWWVVV